MKRPDVQSGLLLEETAEIRWAVKTQLLCDLRNRKCAVPQHKGGPAHQQRIPVFQGRHLILYVEQVIQLGGGKGTFLRQFPAVDLFCQVFQKIIDGGGKLFLSGIDCHIPKGSENRAKQLCLCYRILHKFIAVCQSLDGFGKLRGGAVTKF